MDRLPEKPGVHGAVDRLADQDGIVLADHRGGSVGGARLARSALPAWVAATNARADACAVTAAIRPTLKHDAQAVNLVRGIARQPRQIGRGLVHLPRLEEK